MRHWNPKNGWTQTRRVFTEPVTLIIQLVHVHKPISGLCSSLGHNSITNFDTDAT